MNSDKNNIYCAYCLKPFNFYFIKCIECKNITLCIPCFSYGIQGGNHKKNHLYSVKVSNKVSEVFVKSNWSIIEEQKLLDAIELYGVGNWNDVSCKVESHSADECRDHYINYYINSAIGKYLLNDSKGKLCQVSDHSVNVDNSNLSPSLFEVMPPCVLSVDDQVMLGYMPKRDDFERDYDNDAESILCRLKPDFIKDDLLDALKVAHVGIYTQRLKERQRRKLIAREHGLIGPIMSCILNRRWKPSMSSDNPKEINSKIMLSPIKSPKFSDNRRNETLVRNKPFTLLSPNTLSSPPCKSVRKVRMIDKTLSMTSAKKSRVNELSRNRPYDAFMISENLKPFLRYLTFSQAKALLENLHREEILKFEISNIINSIKRGRRKVFDMPVRYPLNSNIFVRSRPRIIGQTENGNSSILQDCDESPPDRVNGQFNTDIKKKRKRKARPYFFIRKRRR